MKSLGSPLAPSVEHAQPSKARQRTLQLQKRAITFAVAVNATCPAHLPYLASAVNWGQLVRAADSASNNLVEADNASSDADFLHKMRTALREAKESHTCLTKIRLGKLAAYEKCGGLEQEAGELSAIFATIVLNTSNRLEREKRARRQTRT